MIILRQKQYGFKSFIEKVNKVLIPGSKTYEEAEGWWAEENRARKERERKETEEMESKLPLEYKRFKALKLEISKIYPGLGDGDEYMCVRTYPHFDESNPNIIQQVIYTPQRLSFSYDTKNKCWIDEGFEAYEARKNGRRVMFSQIKKALLDEVNYDISDWKKNLYWEDDENEEVITFLEKEKKLIQTKL
jgi:hypothetical protein